MNLYRLIVEKIGMDLETYIHLWKNDRVTLENKKSKYSQSLSLLTLEELLLVENYVELSNDSSGSKEYLVQDDTPRYDKTQLTSDELAIYDGLPELSKQDIKELLRRSVMPKEEVINRIVKKIN